MREGDGPVDAAESESISAMLDCFPEYALLIGDDQHVLMANETARLEPRRTLIRAIQDSSQSESELHEDEHDEWLRVLVRPTPFRDDHGQRINLHLAWSITDRKRLETQQAKLVDLVFHSRDVERRRIARELHDAPLQALGWVSLRLQRLAERANEADETELRELQRFVEATAEGVRRIAFGLHPSLLEDLGLHAALGWHIEDFKRANDVEVDLHITGLDQETRLHRSLELMLYRVVQEALANVAQHSGAKHASVVLNRRNAELQLIIEDDGCGIDDNAKARSPTPLSRGQLGLTSIRERVALVSGDVTIESRPEGGTVLYVTVPLKRDRP